MAWEHHEIGAETLERMKVLDHYNDWIIERIQPWIGESVLEVGSGIGNISRYFLDRKNLILSDVQDDYLAVLKEKFGHHPHVSFARYNLEESGAHLRGRGVDTIVALNVLEHIKNDRRTLKEMSSILAPGGHIILQLPAHRLLYSSLDINLDHFRRYTIGDIRKKFADGGISAERFFRMNMFGTFGWLLYGRILKKKLLPKGPLSLFNILTPLFMSIERTVPVPFGLSIIAIGRKDI